VPFVRLKSHHASWLAVLRGEEDPAWQNLLGSIPVRSKSPEPWRRESGELHRSLECSISPLRLAESLKSDFKTGENSPYALNQIALTSARQILDLRGPLSARFGTGRALEFFAIAWPGQFIFRRWLITETECSTNAALCLPVPVSALNTQSPPERFSVVASQPTVRSRAGPFVPAGW
jgi:hypothetical protein